MTFSPSSILATPINETWVHYNKVNASSIEKGIKEYWVSCSSQEHRFLAPMSGTIREGGTPSRDFINSLSPDDDRLIDIYGKLFDFNNGLNSYITIKDGFESLEIVDNEGLEGSKALKASRIGTSYLDSHLSIDKGYLDYVFSDPKVKSLSFYAKGTLETNNFRHKTVDKQFVNNNNYIISCYERNDSNYGIKNTYKRFCLTRGVYSQMGESDWFIQYGGTGSYDLYLDGFSVSFSDYYDYSLNGVENGFLNKSDSTTYYLRDAASGLANFIITTGNEANTVDFDYTNCTEGYRSIKINKTNSSNITYYLRWDYAYENIPDEGIYFDFYTTVNLNGWWSGQNTGAFVDGKDKPVVDTVNKSIKANTWYTFHFTKDQITSDGRFLIHKSPVGTMYIDNIRLATRELTSFENVGAFQITSPSYDTNDGYGGASKNRFENNEANIRQCLDSNSFLFASKWKVCSAAEITSERASDGLYSLKLTKATNGTLEICPQYVEMLGEDDAITFDAYTDDLDRLTATTIGGNTLTLANGEWTTISLTKEDFVANSGRFTTNAFGAGTLYIDNIRLSKGYAYSNHGVAHYSSSQGAKIKTSLSMDEFHSLSIDGDTAFINGAINDEIEISQSSLSEGMHVALVSYFHDGHLINEHIYFEGLQFTNISTGLSVSATYGDNSYYTLSGYSNVYRMMVGDKEFPYETDGSSYLLPKAALVQMLPESNNQKVSGVVKLKMFTNDAKYIVPINVTLSGTAEMKALPTYSGEGIGSHAYSSTNSKTSRTDYEQYLGMDKVAEFQNTGLEMMYEQALHVGKYEYTLSDAMTYLFDNAAKLNQKVMVVDATFTVLSKYNTSIIGVDLLENVDSVGNPTGNKFSNQNIPIVDGNYRFSSTTELDSFVEHRLGLYMNHPACKGVNIGDEQTYLMLNGGFKDLMASIKRVKTKLNREDFYVNANLQPLSATDLVLTGVTPSGTVSDAKHEQNYVTYLNAFVQNSGLDYVQFDAYPFADSSKSGIYERKGLNKHYIRNILIVANYCKNNNLDMYMVTQSVTYYGTRILNRNDIAWISNMVLGMGVKHISFFVYCVRAVTGSETWIDGSAFLCVDGTRSDLYYYFQSQIHEINALAPVISCFDYEWVHLYRKATYNTATIYTQATSSASYTSSSTYGELSSVTTSKDWTMVTGLRNSDDGKYMYMVQNVYNSFDANLLQTVTLTFKENYEYAVIYEAGLPRIVNMNATTLQVNLSAGHATYVMVY